MAKQVLREYVEELGHQNQWWLPHAGKRAMSQAFLATQFLHEVSETLFQMSNDQNGVDRLAVPSLHEHIPVNDSSLFQGFHVDCPNPFPGTKWDHRWSTLVCHYFSLLQWPLDPTQGPPISYMEVFLDFRITFQVTTPLNKRNMRKNTVIVGTSLGNRSDSPAICHPEKNHHFCRLRS